VPTNQHNPYLTDMNCQLIQEDLTMTNLKRRFAMFSGSSG